MTCDEYNNYLNSKSSSVSSLQMAKSYDEIIKEVGDYRCRYQLFLFVLFLWVMSFSEYATILFMVLPTDYYCDWNTSLVKQNLTINAFNYEDITRNNTNNKCSLYIEALNKTVQCSKWRYNNTNTMISEYDIVCDRGYYKNLLLGGFWIGFILSFFTNLASDIYGRRKVILIFCPMYIATCFLFVISPSIHLNYILQIIKGFSGGVLYIFYNLFAEISNIDSRKVIGPAMFMMNYAFNVLIAVVAYLIPYWRYIQLFTASFYAPALMVFFALPESSRWLLNQGRLKEAQKNIDWLCSLNKVDRVDLSLVKLPKKVNYSLPQQICHIQVVLRIIFCYIIWVSVPFLYYGIHLNVTFVANNPYYSYILMTLIELPTIFVCMYMINRLGNKRTLYISISIAIISLFLVYFLHDNFYPRIVIGMIGQFFVTIEFSVACMLIGETFPTSLRTTGFGVVYLSRIPVIFLPHTHDTKSIHPCMPSVIIGVIGLLGMLALIPLPETCGKPICQRSEELEPLSLSHICGTSPRSYEDDCKTELKEKSTV